MKDLRKRTYGLLLTAILMVTSIVYPVDIEASQVTWTIDGNQGWSRVYTANNQNDYLMDQQTGSGSVSQDIVGDGSNPSVYYHFDNEALAFRIRVSNNNGGTSSTDYAFKNFAFVGMDADLDGGIDFFLGAYNPSGHNGRVAIYGSESGYTNMGPSSTGIDGKPIYSVQPERFGNYAITEAVGESFNGDSDYFVSFSFSLEDVSAAFDSKGISFNESTPFRLITGTAAQDNSFNQDINGMNSGGWSSGESWSSLGVYSDVLSVDGSAASIVVYFDKNTGDTQPYPAFKVMAQGSTVGSLPSVEPTKRGLYFKEYNTLADGSGEKVASQSVLQETTTVYAIWSYKENFTVTFDPNGGNFDGDTSTRNVSTQDGVIGRDAIVEPLRDRYYFVGWNTTSDGKGSWVTTASEITGNITLYAIWNNQETKIAAFYDNTIAENGALLVKIYSNGQSNNFNGNPPILERLGYAFDGWDFNGSVIPEAQFTISQQGDYYATWRLADYVVSFDDNSSGDQVSNMPSDVHTSGLFGSTPQVPERNGYLFVEWNKAPAGNMEALYASTVIDRDTTFYAIWKAVDVLTFDSNNGSFDDIDSGISLMDIQRVDGQLTQMPQPPFRDGYTFVGWSQTSDSQQLVDLRNVSGYNRLYAVWLPNYDVTFDPNEGNFTGHDATYSQVIGTSYGTVWYLPHVPSRSGFDFKGWNQSSDGTGNSFDAQSVVGSSTTVYAKWESNGQVSYYTVQFDSRGGTSVASIESSENLTQIVSEPVTTREGYTFDGWYRDATLKTAVNYPYDIQEDVTFYAKWVSKAFDLVGNIEDDESPANKLLNVEVKVMRGNSQYGQTVTTDINGDFIIENIPAGSYNLVMTVKGATPEENQTQIVIVRVLATTPVTNLGVITFPLEDASSELAINGNDTPAVVVDHLHEEAIRYFDEEDLVRPNGEDLFVKVIMTVEKADKSSSNNAVKTGVTSVESSAGKDGYQVGIYLDMNINRFRKNIESDPWPSSGQAVTETAQLVSIIIPIPADIQGKDSYRIYRYHNDTVHLITDVANSDGEYLTYDKDNQELELHVKMFSVYGISYYDASLITPPAPTPTPSPSPSTTTRTVVVETYTVTFEVDGKVIQDYTREVTANSRITMDKEPVKEGYIFLGWVDDKGNLWEFTKDLVTKNMTLTASWEEEELPEEAMVTLLETGDHFAYMQGDPSGNFRPGAWMTRGEMTVMFARLLVEKMDVNETYRTNFSDVDSSKWYANAIGYMWTKGYVNGYQDGTFKPEQWVTRAEFAAMAAQFVKDEEADGFVFRDVEASYWASASINLLAHYAIVQGKGNGYYNPEDNITRAEVVVAINRMLNRQYNMELSQSIPVRNYNDLIASHWAYTDIMEASVGHNYERIDGIEVWTSSK